MSLISRGCFCDVHLSVLLVLSRYSAGEPDGEHASRDRRPTSGGRILHPAQRRFLHRKVCWWRMVGNIYLNTSKTSCIFSLWKFTSFSKIVVLYSFFLSVCWSFGRLFVSKLIWAPSKTITYMSRLFFSVTATLGTAFFHDAVGTGSVPGGNGSLSVLSTERVDTAFNQQKVSEMFFKSLWELEALAEISRWLGGFSISRWYGLSRGSRNVSVWLDESGKSSLTTSLVFEMSHRALNRSLWI